MLETTGNVGKAGFDFHLLAAYAASTNKHTYSYPSVVSQCQAVIIASRESDEVDSRVRRLM